jgi:hypothetical protein
LPRGRRGTSTTEPSGSACSIDAEYPWRLPLPRPLLTWRWSGPPRPPGGIRSKRSRVPNVGRRNCRPAPLPQPPSPIRAANPRYDQYPAAVPPPSRCSPRTAGRVPRPGSSAASTPTAGTAPRPRSGSPPAMPWEQPARRVGSARGGRERRRDTGMLECGTWAKIGRADRERGQMAVVAVAGDPQFLPGSGTSTVWIGISPRDLVLDPGHAWRLGSAPPRCSAPFLAQTPVIDPLEWCRLTPHILSR